MRRTSDVYTRLGRQQNRQAKMSGASLVLFASIVKGALKVRQIIVDLKDIHPLTDFKRKTSDFVRRMKKTRRPVILTVNGKAELIVQDAESYQKILDRLDRLETVEAIRAGIADVEKGRLKPARQAFAELREKFGFSR